MKNQSKQRTRMRLQGSYKVFNDSKVGAIVVLNNEEALLFEGKNGRYGLAPVKGLIHNLSPNAYLTRTQDKQLKKYEI